MAEKASVNIGCGGVSTTMVFIVLLLLKVFGYVDWSWWIITSPLWLAWAVILGIALVLGALWLVGMLIVLFLEWRETWK